MTPEQLSQAFSAILPQGEQSQTWFGSQLVRVRLSSESTSGRTRWHVILPDTKTQFTIWPESGQGRFEVKHDTFTVAVFDLKEVSSGSQRGSMGPASLSTSLALDEFGSPPPQEVARRLIAMAAQMFPDLVSERTIELGQFHHRAGWSPAPAEIRDRIVRFILLKMQVLGHLPSRLHAELDSVETTSGSSTERAASALEPSPARTDSTSVATLSTGSSRSESSEHVRTLPSFVGRAEDYVGHVLAVLKALAEQALSDDELKRLLGERLGDKRHAQNLPTILRRLDMIVQVDRQWRITQRGSDFLDETNHGIALFWLLHARYTGFEDVLDALSMDNGATSASIAPALADSLKGWRDTALRHQVLRRLNWLIGCGLAERRDNLYFLSLAGLDIQVIWAQQAMSSFADDSAVETVELGKPNVDPELVNRMLEESGLVFPSSLIEHAITALQAGKHLLLLGIPGTGKSELARTLARAAQRDLQRQGREDDEYIDQPLVATATADWTTYDLIGGWAPRGDGRLSFREGIITRALLERRWVVLDELNRADIDKCFGELFTVLSTPSATVRTPFSDDSGAPVEIGPGSPRYRVGPWFRMIATMNMRDKASLFRMSYALMRRFAVLVVPPLDDEMVMTVAMRRAKYLGLPDSVASFVARCLSKADGVGRTTSLGASFLCDVLDYVAAGSSASNGSDEVRMRRLVAEALACFILPQLNSLRENSDSIKARLNGLFPGDPSLQGFLAAQVDGLLES